MDQFPDFIEPLTNFSLEVQSKVLMFAIASFNVIAKNLLLISEYENDVYKFCPRKLSKDNKSKEEGKLTVSLVVLLKCLQILEGKREEHMSHCSNVVEFHLKSL